MKERLEKLLDSALVSLRNEGLLPLDCQPAIQLERTRDKAHGDWASNLALMTSKAAGRKPREMAELLVARLPTDSQVRQIDIAGPGFINFHLNEGAEFAVLRSVLESAAHYGRCDRNAARKIQIEFVSANPTSALHVGHGRGAAYGMTVANLLQATGFQVQREYYVNDAGRQMNILATSTYLRYLENCGTAIRFPSNGYRGDYVRDIAATVISTHGEKFVLPEAELFLGVAADEIKDAEGAILSGDKEAHIDGLIDNARRLLGQENYQIFFDAALNSILDDIREDLGEFGVHYDRWFSERSLVDDSSIERALSKLQSAGKVYEKGGALWFRSTDYGDDKDRVLVRDNGQATYFASDVAYHLNKFERGFDHVVNIWGADHHGYILRVRAALEALEIDPSRLTVLLVQFVTLWRGQEQVQMSSRSGQFITLRELRQEVGDDAARFYYITRKSEQHIDFDLELATSQSKDNPVYYIQYAHARICSVFEKLAEQGLSFQANQAYVHVSCLNQEAERDLAKILARFPEVVLKAAEDYEPHQVANYLKDLAGDFHAWYNGSKVLVEEEALRNARLLLCAATRQVIHNGLTLLGVSAPQHM